MPSWLQLSLLLSSLFAFVLACVWLLSLPGRGPRLALLAGTSVSLFLVTLRWLLYRPETWSSPTSPLLVRLAATLIANLALVLVSLGWERLRRTARSPLLSWSALTLATLLAVLGPRAFPIFHQGMSYRVFLELPYDAFLILAGFLGPALAFEMLWSTDLWHSREDER